MFLRESYLLSETLKSIFFARLKVANFVQSQNKRLILKSKSYWLTSI